MRKLYQCKVSITYLYKVIVEEGQNPDDVALKCLDEVIYDCGTDTKDMTVRELKITKDLADRVGGETLYYHDSDFEGIYVSCLVEEHLAETEPKINPDQLEPL